MEIVRLGDNATLREKTAVFAYNCSWIAGKHLARCIRNNTFTDWEDVFAAIENGEIIGYCTVQKTDYYPENRYSPWISCLFVDEAHRGKRISQALITSAEVYLSEHGFSYAYIPSDIVGFYEKYGYKAIDTLVNYSGDTDTVFMKCIREENN